VEEILSGASKRLALIADTFLPVRNSSAVQLRDLARAFARHGYDLTVMVPSPDLPREQPWELEEGEGGRVLRLRAPKTKDIGYVRRTLAELAMPFAMLRSLRASPLASQHWDGIIWYSPSIFHGPMVNALKRAAGCRAYLIIRDIFPEWAADMELMGRGPAYGFFKAVARYQYSIADVIGVQTAGNLAYFDRWQRKAERSLEILPNWLDVPGDKPSPIRIAETALAGRKVFVYAGNMGVAQNMDVILDTAERLQHRADLGFLLVGRGSERERLKREAATRGIGNMVFCDEIDPDEIPDLYRQCHAGIVSLDPRHKSHNIPGKFLTYMQSGLPVLAHVNAGNDLAAMVRDNGVGEVSEAGGAGDLAGRIERLLGEPLAAADMGERCRKLFRDNFSSTSAVQTIAAHF
jgi:glycosyltransferase involved in cell wall biosynthesis